MSDVDDAMHRAQIEESGGYENVTRSLAAADCIVLAAEVKRQREQIDGIRTYVEEVETDADLSEVMDEIYRKVGGQP